MYNDATLITFYNCVKKKNQSYVNIKIIKNN